MSEQHTSGLTRRELLKRGAAIGGALWAIPVVQTIGMSPAMASHVSDLCVCLKYDGCEDKGSSGWTELGTSCLDLPSAPSGSVPSGCDTAPDLNAIGPLDAGGPGFCGSGGDGFCIEFDGLEVTIFFPEYCTLVSVAEKGGGPFGEDACTYHLVGGTESSPYTFTILSDCSHLEFCFQC